jgi:formylglycine-generating enzyme required for sulfatase activity
VTSRWRDRVVGVGVAAVVFGAYELGRARAQNIPSMPTMFYGVSLDENGTPITGTRDLRVRFFDGEMGGTQLCETLANSTTVTQGRARIALSETCRTAVQQNANVWVELAVGGSVVGARSRIGAVPYAVEAQRANDLTPAAQQRLTAESDCPRGYTRDNSATGIVLCRKPLAGGAFDEVVRVGTGSSAFWIDRYEASVWASDDARSGTRRGENGDDYEGSMPLLPDNGQYTGAPLYARSISGVVPSRFLTWFQGQETCRASGKRLPNGEEWLTAARGTPDPDSPTDPRTSPRCATFASVRLTGTGTQCQSAWGAQDMVGNYAEFTSEWFPGSSGGNPEARWPGSHGSDNVSNPPMSGAATTPSGVPPGLPAAAVRGGAMTNSMTDAPINSGVFAIYYNYSPMYSGSAVSFRCLIPRP